MMKRAICLMLCAAVLALTAVGWASAESAAGVENTAAVTARDAETFTLYWEGEAIADAVAALRMDGNVFLVTSADAIPGSDALMNAGPLTVDDPRLGRLEGIWRVDLTPLALLAFQTETTIAALNDFPYAGAPALCTGTVRAGGQNGFSSQSVRRVSPVTLDGVNGWTFFSAEGFLPGAAVMDENAMITGLVLSAWGESAGKYFAVSVESVMDALAENDLTEVPLEGLPMDQNDSGIEFTWEGGLLTVDLNALELTEEQAAQRLRIYVNAYPNQYQQWRDFEPGENRVMTLPMPPESALAVFVCQGEGDDEATLTVQTYRTPGATFMDRYSYQETESYLGEAPADAPLADEEAALPAESEGLTVERLFGGETRFYYQMISAYDVEQETREGLLMTLTAPDGQFVCQLGTFVYMPQIETRDVWHFDLTEPLATLAEYAGKKPGVYTLAYYLDGSLGGQIEIEVEE